MTRIIRGEAGGRRLETPTGNATRPTSDRVREALFSSLESLLGTVHSRRFLDVFAGSGAVGLEARSRGAVGVTLIEREPALAALIRRNAEALGLTEVVVVQASADRVAGRAGGPYDIVFLDPPYSLSTARVEDVLGRLLGDGIVAEGAVVVVERSTRQPELRWPGGIEPLQQRRYGETMLWYGRRTSGEIAAGDETRSR